MKKLLVISTIFVLLITTFPEIHLKRMDEIYIHAPILTKNEYHPHFDEIFNTDILNPIPINYGKAIGDHFLYLNLNF